jgi:hypothetical protein
MKITTPDFLLYCPQMIKNSPLTSILSPVPGRESYYQNRFFVQCRYAVITNCDHFDNVFAA